MALSKRVRFEILRRDNHTCRYCGAKAPDVELTVDHVPAGTDNPNYLAAVTKLEYRRMWGHNRKGTEGT